MDDLTDEELYDELIASLAAEGVRATPGPDRTSILIHTGWAFGEEQSERFDPPLVLHGGPERIGRHLRVLEPDAEEALGRALPHLRAAMSLLLIHIMETVQTVPGRRHLVLAEGGVDARPSPPAGSRPAPSP
ncbi:hypothetical protein [Nocardiopsis sp. CNT312]|uniref:hypothetical protein n=1 Tax=Nocardiopsis sp. CNT312 TaxID=1137268 RepID=UPI0004B1A161|nr:hypothetical protein [Nocardiopsis sp. CNT312]